jgi:oligopeptidase A
MSTELTSPGQQECLLTIGDELSRMARRLREIISETKPLQEFSSEIAAIYSNVAYIFVYLEGNERHLDYESLLRQRDKFFNDHELFVSVLRLMSGLNCPDPEREEDRRTWMAWFQERVQTSGQDADEKLEEAQQSAKHILHGIQEDQAKLLDRLGVNAGVASPSAVFYRILSETKKLDTRSKLAQAWNKQRDRRADELADTIDRIITIRRLQAEENGFNTVLEQTFERCNVFESDAHTFITTYLARALDSNSRLASNISKATGCTDRPMDHFGYFVRSELTGAYLPMFPLDGCLDFLFTIAERVLNVKVIRIESENPNAINVAVYSGNQPLGTISFDLLATGHLAADNRLGMRARNSATGMTIKPAGHVLCRFQQAPGATRMTTFESAHSIFHEFGHALNYLLLRKRLPSQSGLDYLPVERLEDLSSWFEKWVFHQGLATHLLLSRRDREGLAQCRRVKMLEFQRTNLERAVTAALDFDVHRRTEGGLRNSFEELDEQFSISDGCFFGDLLGNFTKPMFRANPGASFVYLWGTAYGAQNFAPFSNVGIGDIQPREQDGDRFSSCFDPDEPSMEPSVQAVFDLYKM